MAWISSNTERWRPLQRTASSKNEWVPWHCGMFTVSSRNGSLTSFGPAALQHVHSVLFLLLNSGICTMAVSDYTPGSLVADGRSWLELNVPHYTDSQPAPRQTRPALTPPHPTPAAIPPAPIGRTALIEQHPHPAPPYRKRNTHQSRRSQHGHIHAPRPPMNPVLLWLIWVSDRAYPITARSLCGELDGLC